MISLFYFLVAKQNSQRICFENDFITGATEATTATSGIVFAFGNRSIHTRWRMMT